jgi:hypothetical protein
MLLETHCEEFSLFASSARTFVGIWPTKSTGGAISPVVQISCRKVGNDRKKRKKEKKKKYFCSLLVVYDTKVVA